MTEKNGNGATNGLRFDEEMCERYIFGELTEAEQERFEAAYFDDDVFFDRFMAVKTELLDLYSRGELDAGKRARMEPHFLATEPRRRRLAESGEFIRAVNAISDRDRAPKAAVAVAPEPSFFDSLARFFTLPRLAGAAVLLIAAIGGTFLLSRSGQDGVMDEQVVQQPPAEVNRQSEIPPTSNSTNTGSPTSETEMTANPPDSNNATPQRPVRPKLDVAGRPKTNRSTPLPREEIRPDPDRKYAATDPPDRNDNTLTLTIATVGRDADSSITLRAGATRATGEGDTLTIPAGAKSASISLVFRGERYSKYIVTLTNVAGTEISRNDNYNNHHVEYLGDGSRRLNVWLDDTSRMTEKDYIVKIEGQDPGEAPETIEEYYFHVRRGTKGSTAIPEKP